MSRRTRWIALAGLLVGVALGALLTVRFLLPSDDVPRDGGLGPPRVEGTVLWAVGDGPDGGDDARAVADLIKRGDPDRLLYLGDVYSEGTEEDYEEDYEPLYGRLDPITLPTPGNHEWDNRDEGYDAYWEENGRNFDDHWYSTSIQGWQLISLNSEEDLDPESEQLQWLGGQLGRPGNCRLAFWHAPRYSASTAHGDDEDIEPLWDALEGKAALVVNAHDHNMQRLRERDGITTLISGAGGHSHYEVDRDYDGLAFGNGTDYGALRIELRPGRADFAFFTVGGRMVDSGTVPCHS